MADLKQYFEESQRTTDGFLVTLFCLMRDYDLMHAVCWKRTVTVEGVQYPILQRKMTNFPSFDRMRHRYNELFEDTAYLDVHADEHKGPEADDKLIERLETMKHRNPVAKRNAEFQTLLQHVKGDDQMLKRSVQLRKEQTQILQWRERLIARLEKLRKVEVALVENVMLPAERLVRAIEETEVVDVQIPTAEVNREPQRLHRG